MTEPSQEISEGDIAPDFELPSTAGTTRLSDLKGKKVVLFFYPRADTPGCTKEACEFRDSRDDFEDANAVILGISPDTVQANQKFLDKFSLPYTLLSDEKHAVAESYGVWKEKSMYGRKFMGIERSTFVIGTDGRIEKALRKVKPSGHAEKVLKML